MTSTMGAPQSRAKRLAANREASAASRARKREIEREMRAKCAYLEMHLEHARAHAQTLALENAQLKDALLEMTCGVKPAMKYAAMPVMAGKVAIPADPRVWDLDAWRKTKEDVEKGEKGDKGLNPDASTLLSPKYILKHKRTIKPAFHFLLLHGSGSLNWSNSAFSGDSLG